LLIPFWQAIIPNLRFVIVMRDPLNVALSLEKRDGIPISSGSQLWYRYMLTAVKDTENRDRLFTFYDDYFHEPLHELARVVSFCGLQEPVDLAEIKSTIDDGLRHQHNTVHELLRHPGISDEVKLVYLGSLALMRYRPEANTGQVGEEKGNASDTQPLENLTELIESLGAKLRRLEGNRIQGEDIPMVMRDMDATISQQTNLVAEQGQWIARMQSTIQELEHLIGLRDTQLGEARKVLELRDKQLASTGEVLAATQGELAEIKGSLSWWYIAPLRALKKLLTALAARLGAK
jgi:hypothetical protein